MADGGTQSRGSPGRVSEPITSCSVSIGVRISAKDRHSGERARCSQTMSRRNWSSQVFRQVDGARSSFLGEHSSNAHDQRSGSGGVAQRPKLRSPQCHGVRRFQFDGQDWASGGTGGNPVRAIGSRCVHARSFEVLHDVIVDRRSRREAPMCRRRQCVWSETVTRESRYGLRGVQSGGSVKSRASADTCTCSHGTGGRGRGRIDLPSLASMVQTMNSLATWRDEVSESEEMGRGADVRNVWARVGDVEIHATVAPRLLDSLAQDLFRVNEVERDPIPCDAVSSIGVQSRSCSSAHSESCWGEMEDIGDDELAEWGTLSCPTSLAHAIPGPHGVDCDKIRVAHHAESQRGSEKKQLLLIRNSQRETVAASSQSRNPFTALDDDQVDIAPRHGPVHVTGPHHPCDGV